MSKSFQTFCMTAAAAVCIGAVPFAMSQFGAGAGTPGITLRQTLHEWRDSARVARQKLEAEEHARQERIETQEAAVLNAVANYHSKFPTCQRQAGEQGLHFLSRMTFIQQCMHQS